MYIVIDRKTENGCDIHNASCAESGVMLCLLLVKDEQDYDIHVQENNDFLSHGNIILIYLSLPWTNSEQGVCADYYFTSV